MDAPPRARRRAEIQREELRMKEPPAPPEIERIEAGDLRDNDRLGELYVQAAARRYWPNSAAAMLEFAALAEKALADDAEGTPG